MYILLIRKPLSEDDGNWFYLAVFWKWGVRLYKNSSLIFGYFGIPWIAAGFYNLLGLRKVHYLNYLKMIWYTSTVLSVYWMVCCFHPNCFFAFTAAVLFLVVTATPNTLFSLTYGEHFLIFPINMSIVFSYYGHTSGNDLYFICAGLMAGWAVQIKPTALLFGVLLPCSYLFISDPVLPLLYYLLSFAGLNLLPVVVIDQYGHKAIKSYFVATFGTVLSLLIVIADKFNLLFFKRFIPDDFYDKQASAYIKSHHQKNIHEQWSSFKRFILPAVADLRLLLILAAAQVGLLLITFDFFIFCMAVLFFLFFFIQQIQKNYYTPHINPCWAPISILAAKTVIDITPTLLAGGVLGLTLIIAILIETVRLSKVIVSSFSPDQKDAMGFMGTFLGLLFRMAQSIGQYIKQHSQKEDKLLVWGDQSSIYLYAEREAFNPDYLFLYTHHLRIHDPKEERKLIHALRENPPEWIIFYNYKFNDGWNMAKVSEEIGIPYAIQRNFRINDDQGNIIRTPDGVEMDFPLYRRDDLKYKEILIDKAIAAQAGSDRLGMESLLKKVLHLFPDDYEASVRMELLEGRTNGQISTERNKLEEKLTEQRDKVQSSILFRLMAELDVREENWQAAIKRYIEARDLNPDDFRIYNGLGEICLHIGKGQQAYQFFRKAMELNPYSADAYNNLGVMLAQDSQREEALACFGKSLSIIPGHPDTLNNMAALGLSAAIVQER
jgi:Flp pilus assembly protein TadD